MFGACSSIALAGKCMISSIWETLGGVWCLCLYCFGCEMHDLVDLADFGRGLVLVLLLLWPGNA